MLQDIPWSEDRSYKSGGEHQPFEFFLNGLMNSNKLDLMLGYFSSSAINVLSLGFATFLYNGGQLRMIANNILSKDDKNAFVLAEEDPADSFLLDLSDIKVLKRSLDEYGRHFFDCLAWLIANKRIQLKIIRPKDGQGISHYKNGVFYDDKDYVGFSATCNFTAYGLLENLERLEVFLSWENSRSSKFVNGINEEFNNIFSGKAAYVEYLTTTDIEIAIKNEFGGKSMNELLIQESTLIKAKSQLLHNKRIKKIIEKATSIFDELKSLPRFPYVEGPRPYQKVAFENWKNNKQQGLLAMATGTGKTITALNCLLEVYKKTGYYKALILVPTITLVNQWEDECKGFNFQHILKVFSAYNWKNDFAAILTRERLSPTEKVSYIIISTYASFSRENIFKELDQLSPKTLLIADECHNMGSNTLLKLLPKINCRRRIGLSATPERQFDEQGNKKLFSFFNSDSGYTYEYSMQEAINNGILCRYFYYPHLVSLTESEMSSYMQLSGKISKFYNSESDSFKNNPILTALLLARKRIIHKAFNKLSAFKSIIKDQYKKNGNLKYTLVYVPEGNDPNDYFETNYFSARDEIESDKESLHLIDVFTTAVKDVDKRTTIVQFTSGTSDRECILEQFANGEIEVLTSMKCLDEGVDVPRSEFAIFCASTGNPRQFIQRRGRILRTHPQKQFAYIHDLVVIPQVNSNSESYRMERSMLKKELGRVKDFALLSENSSYTIDKLLETMNYYNLNLYNNE
jgi:superfamily II DNA or RNA helicase